MPTERTVKVVIDADPGPFARGMAEASAEANAFAGSLAEADSGMSSLVQAGVALAPALVPLGAAAVPAIAGLSMQLGLAAAAAGTAVLAFHGIGDAVKAIDTYKLAPTAANFTKMQQALDKLGPAGQRFALFIDELHPKLQALESVAQQGLFPGVQESLTHLLTLLPQAKSIIGGISTEMGNLAEQGGKALTSDRWHAFLQMLDREAVPILQDMGQTLGHFVSGLAALLSDFTPMANGFSSGLLHMAQSFDKWAQGLGKTQGFQDFLDYVRQSGPEAMHALASIGDALVKIVEAAAPVGSVTLPIITELAKALAALAGSPIGSTLVTAAVGFMALSRAAGLLKSAGLIGENGSLGKNLTSAIAPFRDVTTATKGLTTAQEALAASQEALSASAVKARDAQFALIPTSEKQQALREYTQAQKGVAEAEKGVTAAEEEQQAALSKRASVIGRAVGTVGLLAVAQSGLADKVGLSNTANYAMLGMLAGPYGAAVGGAVGLVQDLATANNDLGSAIKTAQSAAASQVIDLNAQQQALGGLAKASHDYNASVSRARDFKGGVFDFSQITDGLRNWNDIFTGAGSKGADATQKQAEALGNLKTGLVELQNSMNPQSMRIMSDPSTAAGLAAQNDQLSKFASDIAPAAARAGLNLRHVLTTGQGMDQLKAAVVAYNREMSTAPGQTRAVASALAGLSSQAETTAAKADTLKTSLDSLFGTKLSQSAADDQWIAGLRDLRTQIDKTNGAILGNSKAALDNRNAVRTSVTNLSAKIAADAAAGVSGDKLTASLLRGRQAIIDQAVAAGAKRPAIKAYLDQLNLTPKSLSTIIMTPGLLNAQQQVKALASLYHLTPKQVATLIAQPGMHQSQADIDALAKKYGITPKEVRTILKAIDEASGPIGRIRSLLAEIQSKHITITAGVVQASPLGFLTHPGKADGGTVEGSRYPYGDKVLTMLAPGEEVISNRHGQADRFRADRAAGLIPGYADGGTVRAIPATRITRSAAMAGAQHMTQVHVSLPSTLKVDIGGETFDARIDKRAWDVVTSHATYPTGRRH